MTSKQRAKLRAMANKLSPVLHIGRDGITKNVVHQAWGALESRELIKVALQNGSLYSSAREASDILCELVHAEPVQCIGKRFTIYRPAREPVIDINGL